MQRLAFLSTTALLFAACGQQPISVPIPTMEITSSVFEHNGNVPAKYTCDGDNVSPPLIFSNIPKEAESVVLLVDDPDAPTGDWVHWVVFDIDPSATEVSEGSVPQGGTEGITSFNTTGYGGPCPPSGTHRYFFKLFALDNNALFDNLPNKAELLSAVEGHILEQAELIGLYERRK